MVMFNSYVKLPVGNIATTYSYGHLWVVITGYSYGIIHSINVVSSVLITGISGHKCTPGRVPRAQQRRALPEASAADGTPRSAHQWQRSRAADGHFPGPWAWVVGPPLTPPLCTLCECWVITTRSI